jgi:hypothetical protein
MLLIFKVCLLAKERVGFGWYVLYRINDVFLLQEAITDLEIDLPKGD